VLEFFSFAKHVLDQVNAINAKIHRKKHAVHHKENVGKEVGYA